MITRYKIRSRIDDARERLDLERLILDVTSSYPLNSGGIDVHIIRTDKDPQFKKEYVYLTVNSRFYRMKRNEVTKNGLESIFYVESKIHNRGGLITL